jgi:hypothetical protein
MERLPGNKESFPVRSSLAALIAFPTPPEERMAVQDPMPRGTSDCPDVVAAARRVAPAPADYTSSAADLPFQSGPLYQQRAMFIALWTATAGNALGIARDAIDDFIEFATREVATMSTVPRHL